MWKAVCRDCGWTSGEMQLREAAQTLGDLHQEEQPGHTFVLKQTKHRPGSNAIKRELRQD